MRLLKKGCLLFSLLFASNVVFASQGTTLINLSIYNNMLLSWNLMINTNTTNLSPVIERYGGTATWSVSANNGVLNPVGIYFSATSTSTPCLSQDRIGIMALNPASYTSDVITIIVNPSEKGLPVCSCVGSACDVGFV